MKNNRHALVFGATGFIGEWLVKELLDQGIPTTAAVRAANVDTSRRVVEFAATIPGVRLIYLSGYRGRGTRARFNSRTSSPLSPWTTPLPENASA